MASQQARPQRISTPITKVIGELESLYNFENDPEDERALAVVWKIHLDLTEHADFHNYISDLLRHLYIYDSHIDALYPTSEGPASAKANSARKLISSNLRRLLLRTYSTSWSEFLFQYQFSIEEQLPLLDELAIVDFSEFHIPENERDQLIQQVTDLIDEIADSGLDSHIKAEITRHLSQIERLLDDYDVTNFYPLRQAWELLRVIVIRNYGALRALAEQQPDSSILARFRALFERTIDTPIPKLDEIADFFRLPPPQL